MGWGGGTAIAVSVAQTLQENEVPDGDMENILAKLVEELRDQDWDQCQDAYGEDDILDKVLVDMGLVTPEDDDKKLEEANQRIEVLEKVKEQLVAKNAHLEGELKTARQDRLDIATERSTFRKEYSVLTKDLAQIENHGIILEKWVHAFAQRLGLSPVGSIKAQVLAPQIDAKLVELQDQLRRYTDDSDRPRF